MKIYQTVEPVPSRVIGLLHLLRSHGKQGLTRDALLELLQPTSIRSKEDADTLAANTILALKELSSEETPLIEEKEDDRGQLRLSLAANLLGGSSPRFEAQIRALLERSAFRPVVDGSQNSFATVCAWLLWQTPSKMPQGHSALKTRMQADGLDYEALGLRADARWDVVVYWATYFGLLWQYQDDKCLGLVPDPTSYLSRHLDELLPPTGHVSAHDFKASVGALCPVLDGGVVNAAVADVLAQKSAIALDYSSRISPALSLALRNLRESGLIRYWCPDDQRVFHLMSFEEKVAFVERVTN